MSRPNFFSPVIKSAAVCAALATATALPVSAGEANNDAQWNQQIREELARVQNYPSRALEQGVEGTVMLRVDVANDGRVEDYAIMESSGSPVLDRAVFRMASKLERLPAPASATDASFVVPLTFKLAEKRTVKAAVKDPVSVWRDAVRRRVANTVSYPRDLAVDGVEGRVKVRLTLNADGSVERQEIAQSSGNDALDAEALLLANRIGKLPSLPEGQEPGDIVLPVHYKLAENR
ncbi:TonB family protein [Kordiimonas sp.]|uniref:TonB family protein n=1 Tax=Kordiimonas sp. TaxID=1970157 RepID=UPI003A94B5A0